MNRTIYRFSLVLLCASVIAQAVEKGQLVLKTEPSTQEEKNISKVVTIRYYKKEKVRGAFGLFLIKDKYKATHMGIQRGNDEETIVLLNGGSMNHGTVRFETFDSVNRRAYRKALFD